MPSKNGALPSAAAAPPRLTAAGDGEGRINGIQRARMLAAMAEVCAERGAANVTVAHVVGCSGVSRRTFYELFDDRDDCFLAALEEAVSCASRRVLPAYASSKRWLERMRAALLAALEFLEQEPYMGRLLVVETLGAGVEALRRRQELLARVIAAVDEGRGQPKALAPPPLTAEGVVGGVLSVLHARLVDPSSPALRDLAGELMSMIVLPYLGASAARRELALSVPVARAARKPAPANPLQALGMRLTYRTVRVLGTVADRPGSSNREIAVAAEIHDQGQTSKLLTRLEGLGLIENRGVGASRGAPNAWTLTARGREVQETIAQTVVVAGAP
jgi:AcrR family transcriptional regulator/DNA-binding MarR family transcriptional regulator